MVFSLVVIYIALAVWYLFENEKGHPLSTPIGVLISSFMAYLYWEVDTVAMLLFIGAGLVCIFFHWIAVDTSKSTKRKSKGFAIFSALFLGWCGAHRFYLRKAPSGLLYVLFFWTNIPFCISIVEAIFFMLTPQQKFDLKYNNIHENHTSPSAPCDSAVIEQTYTPKKRTMPVVDDALYEHTTTQDCGTANYRDIVVCGYNIETAGNIEDFSIKVNSNGKIYTFKSKNGNICSYRSSTMRGTKFYEVAENEQV